MKTGNGILAILASVAAGAIGGILFAPARGEKTRKEILTKGEEYGETLKQKFDQIINSIADKYETVKEDAKHMFSDGQAKKEDFRKDGKGEKS